MGKIPYMPLYIGDWEQDTNCLSIEAEGSWLKVVFKCWKNKGIYLSTIEALARLCRVSPEKFAAILLEWKSNDICDIEEREDGGVLIVCRRHIKDIEKSNKKAANGSKGGASTQAKFKQNKKITQAKFKQIPDNDIDNEDDIDLKNIKESEPIDSDFEDYKKWTEDVINGNDFEFDAMLMNEKLTINGQLPRLARDYLGLLAEYPNKRPGTQARFRYALISHIRKSLFEPKAKQNSKGIDPEELKKLDAL
jgi:uncharacterized protein YdaU (DUF1376 family)